MSKKLSKNSKKICKTPQLNPTKTTISKRLTELKNERMERARFDPWAEQKASYFKVALEQNQVNLFVETIQDWRDPLRRNRVKDYVVHRKGTTLIFLLHMEKQQTLRTMRNAFGKENVIIDASMNNKRGLESYVEEFDPFNDDYFHHETKALCMTDEVLVELMEHFDLKFDDIRVTDAEEQLSKLMITKHNETLKPNLDTTEDFERRLDQISSNKAPICIEEALKS